MKKFSSLDSFKEALSVDKILQDQLGDLNNRDTFDPDNGIAMIHKSNLMPYLEKFMCKDEEELSNFLYYKKGIFLKII